MIRLALLVLYLIASFSAASQSDAGSGWDPHGLTTPAPATTDRGSSWDPLG